MSADYTCRICGSAELVEIDGYTALSRVTSDSKPWPAGGNLCCCTACSAVQKLPTPEWMAEIAEIYGNFELYHQSGGAEQPIFDAAGGTGAPRSIKIVEHLAKELGLAATGDLLDFGCGNGDALASFAGRFPDWKLFGAELNDRALEALRRIPSFEALYTCPPDEIDRRFDVVTLIHSLEHMTDPVATLTDLASKVAVGGHLLVEVPDCEATPYDLVVADHLLHFSKNVLEAAGSRAGFETVSFSNEMLPKELTWIGRPAAGGGSAAQGPSNSASSAVDRLRARVAWLNDQVDAAGSLAAGSENFGVFGTSISATWLDGSIDNRASFFVDEDPQRKGREHMGRPVLAPGDVPAGADVYMPLVPAIARAVAGRLNGGDATYNTPPDF